MNSECGLELGDAAPEGAKLRETSRTRDAVLYQVDATRHALFNLTNLLVSALARGLVVNAARSGLGTEPAAGPALEADSLYYQGLRIYSAFDWEFQRQLQCEPKAWPLPRQIVLTAGRFSEEFLNGLPSDKVAVVEKYRAVSQILAPQIQPFEIRRLPKLVNPTGRECSAESSAAFKQALWRGTCRKLRTIERDGYRAGAAPVQDKLQAMLGAFSPLATSFSAEFVEEAPARSNVRVVTYLPAFHRLVVPNQEDPETWHLRKGFARHWLATPVQISTAQITDVSYLEDAELSAHQASRLEYRRHSDSPDAFQLILSFGRLVGPGEGSEFFAFDPSDHRDALRVGYRMHFAVTAQDGQFVRLAKERLNEALSVFEFEAHVRELGLTMHRPGPKELAAQAEADVSFRPRFAAQESKISFRVHRYTDQPNERIALLAMGFTCEDDVRGRARFHCYRDFKSWDALAEKLLAGVEDSPGALAGELLQRTYERYLSRLIGLATREVLDRSMSEIEDAIDGEAARLASWFMDGYLTEKRRLAARLRRGLTER